MLQALRIDSIIGRDLGPVVFSSAVFLALAVLLLPLSPRVLDLCFSLSIAVSIVLLVTTLFISKAVELSVFPTVLLVVTIFRLALNVASTRLILSEGHKGASAAGHVIEAFGHFVMSGNVVIGVIIFSVLMVINFIVITKGAGRIAEVAARFTLDSLPGKQMAIDADLAAGLLDEAGAKRRRRELEEESNFFAAMDGASKFVKGDAVAGFIIIGINIVGGLLIGPLQKGLSFAQALETYTLLTIGDGLVAQLPALIVSAAAGLLITKAGSIEATDKLVSRQFGSQPGVFLVAASTLGIIGVLPGIPMVPFFALAGGSLGLFAFLLRGRPLMTAGAGPLSVPDGSTPLLGAPAPPQSAPAERDVKDELAVDVIRIELGYGLLPMLQAIGTGSFVDNIKKLRRSLAREFGVLVPPVRVQDNLELDDNSYAVLINEGRVGLGVILPGELMVMGGGDGPPDIPGRDCTEPAFGMPARWISPMDQSAAESRGYTVVNAETVITTYIGELMRLHMASLLSYASLQEVLEGFSDESQKLFQAVMPSVFTQATLLSVLRGLLRERVSIRSLAEIVEAVAEWAPRSKDTAELIENVRFSIRRLITYQYVDAKTRQLQAIVFAPTGRRLDGGGDPMAKALDVKELSKLVTDLGEAERRLTLGGTGFVLVVPDRLRAAISEVLRRRGRVVPVLAQREIDDTAKVAVVAKI